MRKLLPLLVVCLCAAFTTNAQCSTANINWQALDFIKTDGYGIANAAAVARNQAFAIGKNRLNIAHVTCTSPGENGTHTGEAGTYGTGDDVQFSGNGTIALTFASAVTNVKFSVYDIDKGQTIAFAASNGGVATPVAVTKASSGSTKITITGSTVSNPSSTGNEQEDDNLTSVNVDIAGPVSTITLTITNSNTNNGGQADSYFWLSDISACVTEIFPSNYYRVSRPYTGMPEYVLLAANKGVYMLDPATGRAKLIFTDGSTSGTINSLAYDPYNKVVYYCWSLTNNGSPNASEKTLRKYDFKTSTATTVVTDVNSVRLPTLDQGVESGGAAFYDGALYLGIEGGVDNGNGGPKSTLTNRESIIWRVDFDASGNPTTVAQVFGTNGDTHDWSDFGIVDGMLYDSNGESTKETYYHYNLQTGAMDTVNDVGVTPKQTAVGWDGKVYWVSNQIGQYNFNGGVGPRVNIVGSPTAIGNWSNTTAPSFGDAAEAFRPKADFGDAPHSYDLYEVPGGDTLSPALHEISSNLTLGTNLDDEWSKSILVNGNATDDGSDEDGLAYARIFVNGANYLADLRVYNNTGTTATVCAWLDFNNDGLFQSTEGTSQTVTSSTTTQPVSLFWASPVSSLPNNSYSYLRIRITTAAMTTSNPTGYFPDGEVEDYRVFVSNTPLDVKLTGFDAKKAGNNKVSLTWSVTDDEVNTHYELQKSSNGQDWSVIHKRVAQQDNAKAEYESFDAAPYTGDNYYRLKITEVDDRVVYSAIKKLVFEKPVVVAITPNPASLNTRLTVQSGQRAPAKIRIVDMNGRSVYERAVVVEVGLNGYTLPVSQLPSGVYQAEIWIDTRRYTQQLIVSK